MMDRQSIDEQWDSVGDYSHPYNVSKELLAKLNNVHNRMKDLMLFGHENDKEYLKREMDKLCRAMMESFNGT